ncbi:hypothetical protein ACFX2F_026300 [Malus domestica]
MISEITLVSTIAVHDHGPLSKHSHFSLSSNSFPAVSDIGVLKDEYLLTCLSLSRHHWKPQGPAVSDRGDQISDPMDEDPLTRLSLSLDYSSSTCSGCRIQPQTRPENLPILFQPQGSAVSDRGDQISDPMDEDLLTRLSRSLDHWKPQGPAVSDKGDQISDPMDEDLHARLSLSIHHWKPQGPTVSDIGGQISDPMDEDPLTLLSLSLDYSSSTCSCNIKSDT